MQKRQDVACDLTFASGFTSLDASFGQQSARAAVALFDVMLPVVLFAAPTTSEDRAMAVSSVSSNVPPAPPPQASAPPTPPVKNDNDNDDRNSVAPKAPLPPGQGTRVDQLA